MSKLRIWLIRKLVGDHACVFNVVVTTTGNTTGVYGVDMLQNVSVERVDSYNDGDRVVCSKKYYTHMQ